MSGDLERLAWHVHAAEGGGVHETQLLEELGWPVKRFSRAMWMARSKGWIDTVWTSPGRYLVAEPAAAERFRPLPRQPEPKPETPPRLVQVVLPDATFGLAVRDGRVVDAPPIARWAVGKPEGEVAGYYRARGARFRTVP